MSRRYKLIVIAVAAAVALVLTVVQNRRTFPSIAGESASAAEGPAKGKGGEAKTYDLSSLQTLNGTLLLLSKCYVAPTRFSPKKMFKEALHAIEDEVPSVIARFDEQARTVELQMGAARQTFAYGKVDGPWSLSAVLKPVFAFIKESLAAQGGREKPEEIEYAAVNGMLGTLDPHTRLLTPEFYDEMKMDTEGEFGGIGIVISSPEGKLTVNEVLEGTPAEAKGLKCGDQIVQIEEESTVNMDLEQAVSKLRGKSGTKVKVWIAREGLKAPKEVELERADIHIQSVKQKMLGGGVGYVKVSSFQENTYEDLKNALEQLKQAGMKSLVFDLRGNAGGLLDQAIEIADIFLYAGTVTTTHVPCSKDPMMPYPAKISGSEPNYPIVMLINRGSASASEIVAGALKNHNRALVVGERSFGKGSIQQLKEMRDGSALKYTIGEYLTPGDVSIQGIGIMPDVQLVPLIVGPKHVNIFFSDEDVFRESDLDRHLVSDKTIKELKPKQIVEYVLEGGGEEKNVCPPPFDKILSRDDEVRLAHDLAKAMTQSNRLKMLEEGAPLLAAAREEQDAELAKALGKLKVDWGTCAAPAGGAAEKGGDDKLAIEFYQDGKKVDALSFTGGEKSTVRVDVKNGGDRPLCRLYAIAESDNRFLDGREWIFGKVAPGKKRSWEVELEVPMSSPSRSDPVTFTVRSFGGPDELEPAPGLAAAQARAAVTALDHPLWEVGWELKDDGPGANQDGVLVQGEEGRLVVHVRNAGKGKSGSMVASVKNLSGEGVYILKGRESFKNLLPGKEMKAEIKIRLLPKFKGDSFTLKVMAQDADFPVFFSKEAVFPATAAAAGAKPGPVAFDRMPLVTITAVEPPLSGKGGGAVGAASVLVKGVVEDDASVEDLYVYADDTKIFYQSNKGAQDPSKMPFEFTASLHGGSNVILVFARQDENTTASARVVIRRDNPDGTPMPTPKKKEEDEGGE